MILPSVATYPTSPPDDFAELGQELARESWEALSTQRPGLASAVQKAVERGRSADEVRAYVYRQTHNDQISQFCEQAARHLISLKKPVGVVMLAS